MRYFIIVILLVSGNISFVHAQNIVSGRITNSRNEVLTESHIHVGDVYALSDSEGNYTISIPNGKSRIVISYVGYKTIIKDIEIKNDMTLNFSLVDDIFNLLEVVVKDTAVKTNITISKQVITTKTIERYSNAALGDLLKEISGVSSLKTGNTIVKPVINGLHSSRVLVVNNNVRLEDQQWGLEHAPNLDVNTAGRVSVIKGASGLQYGGDAIGGVVIVEPEHIPITDTLFGKTLLNGATNGRGGNISSSLFKGYKNGWEWNVQGTFKYLGDFEAPDYVLSNTGDREKNFSGGFGYKGKKMGFSTFYSFYDATIGILRASHIGNTTDLVNAINNGQPYIVKAYSYNISAPKQEVRHHLAKLSYYYFFAGLGKLTFQYSYQFNNRLEFDLRKGNYKYVPSVDLDLKTHSANLDFETLENHKVKYKFGLSGVSQTNVTGSDTRTRALIPNYDKVEAGAYIIGTFGITSRLVLEGGFRYDYSKIDATKFYLQSRWEQKGYDVNFHQIVTAYFPERSQLRTNPIFSYYNLAASLGTKFEINPNLKWFVNGSLGSRSPNPSELFSDGLHHATGQIEIGDLRLQNEQAIKFATTVAYTSPKLALEVNPYVNFINNFTVLEPTGLENSIRGTFPVWEYRQVNARLTGIDVSADWDFVKNLNYHSTIAYVYGENRESGKPLIDLPPLNWNNAIRFTRENWHHLGLGLKSELVFTQKRFPDNDFYADVLIDGTIKKEQVKISEPPAGYHLLTFYSEMPFALSNKVRLNVQFAIQNIFDTEYRDYLNRIRYYAADSGRNFTLQLKLNY